MVTLTINNPIWLFINKKQKQICPPLRYNATPQCDGRFFQAIYPHTAAYSAEIPPGLQRSWSIVPKTTDKWTLVTHRGRRDLAVRDIPVVWLVMCAKPGKLLASLASPPLVRSWWMAVVLATPPVVTTGTARSRVLPLPTVVRTWPGGFPLSACGHKKRDIKSITTSRNTKQSQILKKKTHKDKQKNALTI